MIVIIFGKTGSGKSFIANILKETYGFHYLEGDDFFTEEMMRIIKADKIISEDQREQFVQSMIDGTIKASREKTLVVLSQLFLSDKTRHAVHKAIPEAVWLYVEVEDLTRYTRLRQRENHFANAEYAKKMDEKFEDITIHHHTVNNNNDAEHVINQIRSILDRKL